MTQDRNLGGSHTPRRTENDIDEHSTHEHSERAIPVREERIGESTARRHEEIAVYHGDPEHHDSERPVNVVVADRHDGVRWGPVWAGLLTALTLFLLLELMFYAFGWLTLDPGANESGSSRGLITGILALVAFFIGGLIAGATALWKGLFSGLLHGSWSGCSASWPSSR